MVPNIAARWGELGIADQLEDIARHSWAVGIVVDSVEADIAENWAEDYIADHSVGTAAAVAGILEGEHIQELAVVVCTHLEE